MLLKKNSSFVSFGVGGGCLDTKTKLFASLVCAAVGQPFNPFHVIREMNVSCLKKGTRKKA